MKVRLATRDDAEAVMDIYNREVVGSTVTFDMVPRTLEDQLQWLDEHSGAHPAVVAVDDQDRVRGFGSLSPYRSRPAYRMTVEDSVYIHGDARGQGVGKLLLSELLVVAEAHGFHSVMARIVDGHEASIALHRSCGFDLIGVERQVGRKFARWLDVALMQRILGPTDRPLVANRPPLKD
jgi:phosphinothricin acetyltransferase